MKRLLQRSVIVLVAFLLSGNAICQTHSSSSAQEKIEAVSKSLVKREIRKIEIVWMNPHTETRDAITEKSLDVQYHVRLVKQNIFAGRYEDNLIAALRSTIVKPATDQTDDIDLRWGVKFFDANSNVPVVSLYLNGNGEVGTVDGVDVSFGGGFYKWLDKNFSNFFLNSH